MPKAKPKKDVKRKPKAKKKVAAKPQPSLWWLNPGVWLAILLAMVFVVLIVGPTVAR